MKSIIPGSTEIELADGEIYAIPPLTLGAIERLQKRLRGFNPAAPMNDIGTVIDVVYESLRRNYPELTREFVADNLITLQNMTEVFKAVMNVSRMEQRSGETMAGRP